MSPRRPCERRHALAATFDEGRPAGREERHVRAEAGRDRQAGVVVELGAPQLPAAPSRAAAASDEPPPRPAATGIRLSSRAATAGAGPGPPAQPPPTARRVAASARSTRLSVRPASTARPVTWSVSARGGGRRRQAEPVAERERDEDRVQVVVAVRPTADDREGQVELGRGDPDDRRQPVRSVAAHRSRPDRPRRSSPIGPIASRRASHSPTARVCGRRSGSMPAAARAAVDPRPVDRQLAREDVVDHLAALAERRLDQAPELVLGLGIQAVVRVVRLDHDDRRLDRGLRLEGRRRDAEGDPDPGVVLDEHGQVAHLARAAPRSVRRPRAGPSGRSAPGAAPWPSRACRIGLVMWYGRLATTSYGGGDEVDEVLVQRVALHQAERAGGVGSVRVGDRERPSKRARRNAARPRSSSTAVTAAPASSSPPVRRPSPGPISRTWRPGVGAGLGQDALEDVDVGQEVLRQAVAGAQAGLAQRGADDGRVEVAADRAVRRGVAAAGHQRIARGRDGRASRSRPGPLPGREPARPGGPDHRPVVRAQTGSRHDQRHAQRVRLAGEPGPQGAVGGHAATQHDASGRRPRGRPGSSWS